MKARIKETGEIIDILSCGYDCGGSLYETITYVDSEDIRHNHERVPCDFYEFIDEDEEDDYEEDEEIIDWEERRYEIAKEMMPILSQAYKRVSDGDDVERFDKKDCAEYAVQYADALIAELKKGGKDL